MTSLIDAFLHRARQQPEAIAFSEGERSLNYRQLYHAIAQLSALLGPRTGQRIVIALDRGIDAGIAIFATLAVGACYIPIDLKNPVERLRYIIEDADAQCIIGCGKAPAWLEHKQLWLTLEQSAPAPTARVVPIFVPPESLAAILYTSGSTGHPKGVALSHRAVAHFTNWAGSTFHIGPDDRIANLAPFYFDLSLFDLFTGLSAGAGVYFIPAQLTLAPSRLTGWLRDHRISVWYTVPSLLGFIALKGALDRIKLDHLRLLLFAGEVFPSTSLITLCALLPETDLYNLYGPTETNVCCYWHVDRARLQTQQPIPIGIPACDASLTIDTETGELIVAGATTLTGYWQQGRLLSALSKDGSYRTGDKVSLNEHGEYCYHGRLDRMLKYSGYRIEPAEIEHILRQSPDILNCAVVGIRDAIGSLKPAVGVVLQNGATLTEVARYSRQHLPAYMQPGKFVVLNALPYLSNGKIDYRTLQIRLETSS